jgi:hypothetical protein
VDGTVLFEGGILADGSSAVQTELFHHDRTRTADVWQLLGEFLAAGCLSLCDSHIQIGFRQMETSSYLRSAVDSERFQRAVALRLAGNNQDALQEFETLSRVEADSQCRGSLLLNQASCLLRLHRVTEARQRWSGSVGYWRNLHTDFIGRHSVRGRREQE